MYLLAIETTGAYASVALLHAKAGGAGEARAETGEILGVIHGSDRFSHLQNLTPQIDQILKDNQLQIGDIDLIAVSHGPGSFTGIRIGVATARALGQILGIPCAAVSSLEALALRAKELPAGRTLLCPALDARRKQVYGAAYEIVEEKLVCRIPERSILMVDFLKDLEKIADQYESIFFLGDGIDTCGDLIEQWAAEKGWPCGEGAEAGGQPRILYAPEAIRYQDAAAVALRGLQLHAEGRTCDYIQLQPEYLRMAEAEKKLREKQK
ncbi:MAG: tRNA (adenosine(37)-N6)-threonylcarbamoyltransferase complex dimerization subunit type 1 TsaB [Firmicutes bacterium]|nr:tRNA (adenosine(37)-N6)-threonylcarbamoyltransferase complex dimerization subunit type 1 TsaB [Bacillota bacterium]